MEIIICILWIISCISLGSCLGLIRSNEFWKEKWLKDEEKILELEIKIQEVENDKFNSDFNIR